MRQSRDNLILNTRPTPDIEWHAFAVDRVGFRSPEQRDTQETQQHRIEDTFREH
jgi:hypothetical protein